MPHLRKKRVVYYNEKYDQYLITNFTNNSSVDDGTIQEAQKWVAKLCLNF